MNDLTCSLTVTAVVPTFRRPGMLSSAVHSALSQTWRDLRVCIFDNASGGETPDVADRLLGADPRVRYHCHVENLGAIANFSFGVRAVETPLFSIVADDDVMLPGFYEQAMSAFAEYPAAMFVAMTTLDVDESGTVLGGSGSTGHVQRRICAAGEAYGGFPWNWTGWVFRRAIVDAIGFIHEETGPACDIGFLRHVAARFPGVVLPDVAALTRVHPGAPSSEETMLHVKADRRHWDALSRHIEVDDQVPASIRTTVRRSIETMYLSGLRRSVITALIDGRAEFAIETARILTKLGYPISAAGLRTVIACHEHLPFVSAAIREVGRRRRQRQQDAQRAISRRFESRRDEFTALLHGSSLRDPAQARRVSV